MKNSMLWILISLIIASIFGLTSCKKNNPRVVMETTMGNIELKLYNETPLHRDNFISLVKESAYDSLLFHRVIRDFMIQGGDPDSKNAEPGALLGEGDLPYTIPAEFRLNKGIFHRRGVLAAALKGDVRHPPLHTGISLRLHSLPGTLPCMTLSETASSTRP
ncbi:MAG: peptidylprolyl isomerase [Bacteroidales bacterium]|nr:peptidylprolyl isomerase [Bacteroidales bacterium]